MCWFYSLKLRLNFSPKLFITFNETLIYVRSILSVADVAVFPSKNDFIFALILNDY